MSIRPLWLPEPPPEVDRAPEIFAGGVAAVRRAVVIGNGCPGAENQCLGLVRALGLADRLTLYRIIRPTGGINKWLHFLPISLHKMVDQVLRHILSNTTFTTLFQGKLAPYHVSNVQSFGLSSVLEADSKRIVTMVCDTFEKEGLAIVVACGRDTIPYASSVRCLAPDNVFVIQIQHPRYRLDRFDLVVTPRHDYYALTAKGQQEVPWLFRRWITPREPPGPNVVLTAGALHQADSAALRIAATKWHDALAPLPKPLVVVSIGGPTRNCNYGVGLAKQLVSSLHNVSETCGSVRISFSRRTPQKVSDLILREFMVVAGAGRRPGLLPVSVAGLSSSSSGPPSGGKRRKGQRRSEAKPQPQPSEIPSSNKKPGARPARDRKARPAAEEEAQGPSGQGQEIELRKQPPEKPKRVVRWRCATGCGACCKLDKGPEFPTPDEVFADYPDHLQLYKSMIGPDGWCTNYDKSNRTCNIYEDRPFFCRVEPKVFEEFFGVPRNKFDREACSACVDNIKMVYGQGSPELGNFKRVIKEESSKHEASMNQVKLLDTANTGT